MPVDRSEKLIKCKGHGMQPWSIVCRHLVKATKVFIELVEKNPNINLPPIQAYALEKGDDCDEIPWDYCCSMCFVDLQNEEDISVKDLWPACMTCIQECRASWEIHYDPNGDITPEQYRHKSQKPGESL